MFSAGTEATRVRPEAISVMAEIGVDISARESETLDRYLGEPLDLVVTVCDDANEACPVIPGARERQHWSFPDESRVVIPPQLHSDITEGQTGIIGSVPAQSTHDPSEIDLAMMRRALLAAEDAANKGEVPVGAVVARGGRSWPSPPTSARLQGIPPPTPNSSPSVGHPPPQAAGDLQAAPSTPPWNHAPCAPAQPTQAVSLVWSTPLRIPKPDTQAPCTTPPPTPASIIPSSSKAAFSKKEPPLSSATSSSIVARDPERHPNPLSRRVIRYFTIYLNLR
jgi:protein-tyrosine-phosphatase